MQIKRQLFFLHLYNFLFPLRVADGVWVLFLLTRGYTLAQVGLAEGVYHLVSFCCEVPSGMAADLLGRRRTLLLSSLCGVSAALCMAFSRGFAGVCLSMACQALMYNFCSGTLEALTYDSLKSAGAESRYLRQNALLRGAAEGSAALNTLLGGAAAVLGYFPAYLVTALCSCACACAVLALAEPQVTESQRRRTRHPLARLRPRLRAHAVQCLTFLQSDPRAVWKLLASAALATPVYLTIMYMQQHLTACGLPPVFLGGALMVLRLAGAAGILLAVRDRLGLFPCAVLCGLGCGAATALAGAPFWGLALLGGGLAQCCYNWMDLRLDEALNRAFPSDQRATLVSTGSMLYSLLMIAASPVTGMIGQTLGVARALALTGAAVAALTLAGALVYRRGASR